MSKPITQFVVGAVAIATSFIPGVGPAISSWLVTSGLAMVVGSAANALTKKPDLSTLGRDLGINVNDPVAGLAIVYGNMRIGGSRVFVETDPADTRMLWMVFALCHGAIAGIDAIYLDGNEVVSVTGRTKIGVTINGNVYSFITYAHAWKAVGTDGQITVIEHARVAKTVTASSQVGNRFYWDITTSATHGYLVGDIVEFTSVSGLTANYGYGIVAVPTTTKFTIEVLDGATVGTSGTVNYYTPDLATIFGDKWTSQHRGQGVAYIVLRLWRNPERFPSGLPKVEADVRGIAVRDPRTMATLTISTSAVGSAVTGYASTSTVNFSAAHGLVEGDILYIAGHSETELNGRQRADRIVDTDTITIYSELSGAGSGGTAQVLEHSSNPAMCIRDYLTHGAYGVGATTDEINETAFEDEANHHDELVDIPIENAETFVNHRPLVDAVGDGVDTVFTTVTPHDYLATDVVRIAGFDPDDGIDGVYPIDAVTASTFTVALAVTGTFLPLQFEVFDAEGRPDGTTGGYATASILAEQKRFELHGVVDTTQTVKQNLEAMLASCRAFLVYEGGTYRTFTPRPTVASALVLSEANIVGDWEFALPGQGDTANIVRATYFNAIRGYIVDQVEYPPPLRQNLFLADDNFLTMRKEIELPFTSNRATAQQIAMVLRRESRNAISCAVTCHEAALQLAVGDVVAVTHETPGWAAKEFWVGPITLLQSGHVRLTLHEYDETAYDLDAQDDTPFALDTTLVADAGVTHTLSSTDFLPLVAATAVYDALGVHPTDGTSRGFVATWHPPRNIVMQAVRAGLFREDTGSTVALAVTSYREDDSPVVVAELDYVSGTGYQTVEAVGTQGLDGALGTWVRFELVLDSTAVDGEGCSLLWIDIDYEPGP